MDLTNCAGYFWINYRVTLLIMLVSKAHFLKWASYIMHPTTQKGVDSYLLSVMSSSGDRYRIVSSS